MKLNRIHIAYLNMFRIKAWWLLFSFIANCAKHNEKNEIGEKGFKDENVLK